MKVKTSDLIGPALDWAVAKCRGFEGLDEDEWLIRDGIADMPLSAYNPSSDWSQGGPIIEREELTVGYAKIECGFWTARTTAYPPEYTRGPTPLIAAMRCYVASKMGDEVDVPSELLPQTHRKQIQEGAKSNSVNHYFTGLASGDDDSEEEKDLPAPRG
jgi:hypothetical protein